MSLSVVLLVIGACSGSDGDVSGTGAARVEQSGAATTEPILPESTTVAAGSSASGSDVGTTIAEAATDRGPDDAGRSTCGGISTAAVAAASGVAGIDSADDVSVDGEVTCLYSVASTTDAVSIGTQAVADFLAGELVDVSAVEALDTLSSAQAFALREIVLSEQVTIGDIRAVVIVGTSITGGTVGYAGAVANGDVFEVSASGDAIGADATALPGLVTTVLELALRGG